MSDFRIPLGRWIDIIVDWLDDTFDIAFDAIAATVIGTLSRLEWLFGILPWWLFIILLAALAWYLSGWKLALGSTLGLVLIANIGLWDAFLVTLALVLVATLICLIIGIPIGILSAKNNTVHAAIFPILDFMQTMPAFVYLLPAMAFFSIGGMSAAFATIIFAMPPVIRLTDLGIRQVPTELVEAAKAFGSSSRQLLFKVQFPVALPSIMTGVNQTIMLSLSMVVIASLIGAGGLGDGVNRALGQLQTGSGFEYGIAVVIMAMILDRVTQSLGKRNETSQ